MNEAGVLINLEGQPIHWHQPDGRNVAFLPDSRTLWDVIWENRDNVLGFAHSHPGSGVPHPSHEDITSFVAVEGALGRRLIWWIVSSNEMCRIRWQGPAKQDYKVEHLKRSLLVTPMWVHDLRQRSEYDRSLGPCPKCKSSYGVLVYGFGGDTYDNCLKFGARCVYCGKEGPVAETEEEAKKAWNNLEGTKGPV